MAEGLDGLLVGTQEKAGGFTRVWPGPLGWRATLLLFVFGGTLLGISLGRTRVLTAHEVVFTETAREMVHTGDWRMIRFLGVPSTHKPPLTNWLIALSMVVFHSEAEWVCRLPSVLAALLTAWIVAYWAAHSYGRRVGLLAGLIQLTTFYTLMQARLAEADMLLCALVTLAMALFALGNVGTPLTPGRTTLVKIAFFVVCGLTFMTKSVIGPAFIFCGCGLYALIQRRWSALRFLLSPVGWLAFVAIPLPWLLWSYHQYPAFLHDSVMHTFGRFEGQMGGGTGRNVFFYIYIMPAILLPWTPWAVRGIIDAKKQGLWQSLPWRFFFAWMAAGFLILTASAFKAKHYSIPLLPPLSIVTAWFLEREAFVRQRSRPNPWPGVILIALGGVIALVVVGWKYPALWTRVAIMTALLAPLFALALWSDSTKRPVATLTCLFAAFWVVGVGVQTFFIQEFDSFRVQTDLARQANALTPPETPIDVVGLPENQVTYYLRFPLARFDDMKAFVASAQEQAGSERYVLTSTTVEEQLAAFGTVTRLSSEARRPKKGSYIMTQIFLRFVAAAPQTPPSDQGAVAPGASTSTQ